MSNFLKNTIIGIIILSVIAGIIGNYISDNYLPKNQEPQEVNESLPDQPQFSTPKPQVINRIDTQVIIYRPEISQEQEQKQKDERLKPTENQPVIKKEKMNLSGIWEGYSTDSDKNKIKYTIIINQQTNSIAGEIWLSTLNEVSYAKYEIKGIVSGQQLFFEGVKFLEKNPSNSGWCMASGDLKIIQSNNSISLIGSWGQNLISGGCPRGSKGEINVQRI